MSASGDVETKKVSDLEFDAEITDGPAPQRAEGLKLGQRVGRYWLLDQLGRGGMGVVYLGYDSELHRKVAVKVLHDSGESTIVEPRRLLREAQALAKVSHPNLVHVYDVGTIEDRVFMAMELVQGPSLAKWFSSTRPSWRRVLEVMIQAGRGLHAAHAAGLVHRDFKPANVVLGDDGTVRVLDFGLARVRVDAADDGTRSSGHGSLDSIELPPELTEKLDEPEDPLTVGVVLGTPAYMAPEQHVGDTATAKSDQYGFCVTLYEGLYGQRPFPRVASPKLLALKRQAKFRAPPAGVIIPAWLRRVIVRGLSPLPEDRYESMQQLIAQLTVTPTATKLRWVAAIGVAAVVGVGAWTAGRQEGAAPVTCEGAHITIAEVWDEARDARIAESFAATGLAYAGDTWRRLQPVVEEYADAWGQMRRQACRATHVDGTQSGELLDLKMACLDRRRDELSAVLDLYERADALLVERAAQAIGGLVPLSRCADTDALRAQVPLPVSAADREAVVEAQRWLAEADALGAAGQPAAAERRARAAAAEGERLGYVPLMAEAKLVLVRALENDPTEAAREARTVIELASQVGDDRMVGEGMRLLLFIVGLRQGRLDEAAGIAVAARAAWFRSGRNPDADPSLLSDLGLLAAARRETKRAGDLFEQALQAMDDGDASVAARLIVVSSYASMLMQQGAWEAARTAYDQALVLGTQTYGARHPFIADVELNLGQIDAQTGDLAAANLHLEAALETLEASPDQHSRRLALAYTVYASVAIAEGRPAAARVRALKARGHLEQVGDTGGPFAAAIFDVQGGAAQLEGKFAEAIENHRAAVQSAAATHGRSSPNEAVARVHLAEALIESGDPEAARPDVASAAKILEAAFGTSSEHYAEVLVTQGALDLHDGQPEAAREKLESALEVVAAAQINVEATARFRLARAYATLGNTDRARQLAAEARTRLAERQLAFGVARIDAWLTTVAP